MSLAHAILGFLSYAPMTGYDLKTVCFDTSVAHFWQADQAQIYRTLEKLAEAGRVVSQMEIQTERPNRRVYSLTDAGRAELERWLRQPQPLPQHREPFLVQLFFADGLDDDEVLALMEQQRALHQQKLAHYRQIPAPPLDTPDLPRQQLFIRLTLEMGLRNEQAYLDWLELAIEHLRRRTTD